VKTQLASTEGAACPITLVPKGDRKKRKDYSPQRYECIFQARGFTEYFLQGGWGKWWIVDSGWKKGP